MLDVLVPVLKEQEKDTEKREKISKKAFLDRGYHFGSKNFEGSDILRNAVRIRLADYAAGVSLKETAPVPEGWFIVETVMKSLGKEELYIRIGGLVLMKVGDLCRITYGYYYVDIPPEERVKISSAIDRRLYYRNDELGVLVRNDGSVFLFTNLGDRVHVKEPYRLMIFLRVGCYE
ncbi:MAG TPA: hypothetical protein ENJ61_00250 [Aquifex aeolicus]|uniref:Uncharacterized protein n=1 Tax=Aquifex aeolicus TaxID=63363 RepID=A0A7C5PYD3_AQUAO|nr:hypothetical protein [Aquifex aeolicus]